MYKMRTSSKTHEKNILNYILNVFININTQTKNIQLLLQKNTL